MNESSFAKILALVTLGLWPWALAAQDAGRTADGFALPQLGHVFEFPRDYGSHEEFKLEWWYLTGHLFTDTGRRFGFQATFFRSAGRPPASTVSHGVPFGAEQLYLAHMAVLDVTSGTYRHQQRLNRNGWDAFAATNGLDVRNGNWSLRLTNSSTQALELHGTVDGDTGYHLALTPRQPLVVFGSNSVSRKAADPAAASYYLTFPRLAATGELCWDGVTNRVTGEAWMDHEISSSQLGTNECGWDWCCLQFQDGRDLMAYRLRHPDGSSDEFSSLTWVAPDGTLTPLPSAQFSLHPVRTWTSPRTGAEYPVSERLETFDPSGHPVAYVLEPLADNQEMAEGKLSYWEGACRVRAANGTEVGSAFLELTGYRGNLQKELP